MIQSSHPSVCLCDKVSGEVWSDIRGRTLRKGKQKVANARSLKNPRPWWSWEGV